MEYTHLVSVAGLVMNDKGEVLLVKSPLRGWEYPGGIVEPGETLHAALLREIWEESGVQAEVVGFVGVSKNLGRDIVNVDYLCRYAGGELTTSEESLEVAWFSPEAALEAVTLPITRKRLENMLSGDDHAAVFGFIRDPFSVSDEERLPVGRRSAGMP